MKLPGNDQLTIRLKFVAMILAWMLVAAGALWALGAAWPAVRWVFDTTSPFLIALVVAYLFNPIVHVIQRKLHLGRITGIIVVALLIVAIFAAFFGVLLPILYVQMSDILQDIRSAMPGLIDQLSKLLGRLSGYLRIDSGADLGATLSELGERLNLDAESMVKRITAAGPGLTQGGAKAIGNAFQIIGNFFSGIVGFFVTTVLVLVIAFYYLVDFHAIPGLVRKALPALAEKSVMEILGKLDVAVGGFLRGQIIVCCLVALLATIGLTLIGMYKYALIVGLFAGAVNFVPYLGPSAGATPAILWALFSRTHETWGERGMYVALVIALFALIQSIDGFVFQPRIVGKNSNLHPLAVMFALVVGGRFGVSGMILAVPAMCIVRVLFKELWWDRHLAARAASASPGANNP